MTNFKNKIFNTIDFAVKCHKGQFRKDNLTPYIFHPFDVFTMVRNWKIRDIAVLQACLCHDIREECDDILEIDIFAELGEEAAKICEELTFIPDESSNVAVFVQKEQYIDSFANKSVGSLVVKCADRICNTKDFLRETPKYASKYWLKASKLFDTIEKRRAEIGKVYGYNVLMAMEAEINDMKKLLAV